MREETLRDWKGKIIGYIQFYPNGDKQISDFYRKIKGKYDAKQNVTKDFYGRIVAQGDCLTMLLNS